MADTRPDPPPDAPSPRVRLLFIDGCPSHAALEPRLRELVARAGERGGVELVRIGSDEQARAERFLGSPTVRVDGADVEPGARDRTDFGLGCRLYRTRSGLRGTPEDAWVLDALAGRR